MEEKYYTMSSYNWRNVLKHEGTIDPKTIAHARRMIEKDNDTVCELYKICDQYDEDKCTISCRDRCKISERYYKYYNK